MSRLKPLTTILLDDGNATLNIVRTRVDPDWPKYYLAPPNTTRGKRSLKRFLGMRDDLLDTVTYFTVYNFQPEAGSVVFKNRYSRLLSRARAGIDSGTLYFLGTSVDQRDGVTEDQYVAALQRGVAHTGSFSRLYYLPHRHESPERLARLTRELGFSVKTFDAPVEYGICCLSESVPGEVAGFVSSAFVNLNILFGDRIKLKVFHVPIADATVAGVGYTEFDSYVLNNFRPPEFELVPNL